MFGKHISNKWHQIFWNEFARKCEFVTTYTFSHGSAQLGYFDYNSDLFVTILQVYNHLKCYLHRFSLKLPKSGFILNIPSIIGYIIKIFYFFALHDLWPLYWPTKQIVTLQTRQAQFHRYWTSKISLSASITKPASLVSKFEIGSLVYTGHAAGMSLSTIDIMEIYEKILSATAWHKACIFDIQHCHVELYIKDIYALDVRSP